MWYPRETCSAKSRDSMALKGVFRRTHRRMNGMTTKCQSSYWETLQLEQLHWQDWILMELLNADHKPRSSALYASTKFAYWLVFIGSPVTRLLPQAFMSFRNHFDSHFYARCNAIDQSTENKKRRWPTYLVDSLLQTGQYWYNTRQTNAYSHFKIDTTSTPPSSPDSPYA